MAAGDHFFACVRTFGTKELAAMCLISFLIRHVFVFIIKPYDMIIHSNTMLDRV